MLTFQDDIKQAVGALKKGGVILYPTDTIWGIGCDATNPEAVKRVYALKKREDSKSMLVLLDNINWLERYVEEVPEVAWDLVELAEKPLTIIYPGAKNIASNLIAEDGSIGIRVTRETFSTELIRRLKKPIVSTSANISGEPSPTCFADIADKLKASVDYVVGYRQDEHTNPPPSGIIKLGVGGEIAILRE